MIRSAAFNLRGRVAALLAGTALLGAQPAIAQAGGTQPPTAAERPDPESDGRQIVVIGERTIVTALKDVPIEREVDPIEAAMLGVSSIGELLDELARENADDAPEVLVNGRPVRDRSAIADLPVEALRKVEVLPRGAATPVGGKVGQRAYNVVLKPSHRSLVLLASDQFATEGGWSAWRAEATGTLIKGQDRLNLSVRAGWLDPLRESDRRITPLPELAPFAPIGNLIPAAGTQVDPAFSAFVGRPVSSIALPAAGTPITFANLAAGAGAINPSLAPLYRTLRSSSRPIDLSASGAKTVAPWLNLVLVARAGWQDGTGYSGLPGGRFRIPAGHPLSPFSVPVIVAISDPARPLRNDSHATTVSLSATANIQLGEWRSSLLARYDSRRYEFESQRLATASSGILTVPATANPFDGSLAATLQIDPRISLSRSTMREVSQETDGPLLALPAGDLRLKLQSAVTWSSLDATVTPGGPDRRFDRREVAWSAGLSVPLAKPGSALGALDIAAEYGRLHLPGVDAIERWSLGLNWQPRPWVRLNASTTRDGRGVPPELLADPLIVNDNVRYFDPQTGDTVFVTTLYGGADNLRNERQRTDRIALTLWPLPQRRATINVDYSVIRQSDLIGALPPPSNAVVAAFPDRFVRDAAGRLVLVDNRTVNFAEQVQRQLRTSLDLSLPLNARPQAAPQAVTVRVAGAPPPPRPAPFRPILLNVNLAHTWLLAARSTIRAGLPEVDLLGGGIIGLSGGRQRHLMTAAVALARGGSGIRAATNWRSASYLTIGTTTLPNRLTFAPVLTTELRAFAELGELLGSRDLTGTRLTVSVDNLFNRRQDVRIESGALPLAFQPVYRDALGRTVKVELRKAF